MPPTVATRISKAEHRSPGSLTEWTGLVLANVIYSKGGWAAAFDRNIPRPQPFYISKSSQVKAPLMYHRDTVRYVENADMQAVELAYVGRQLAMLVLLP